jgi:methionine-rich copper-binding protein CopC
MLTPKALSLVAVAGAALMLSANSAAAHASLVKSDPADGSTVSALKTVTLTFDEELTPAFSGLALTMGDGMIVTVKTTVSTDHKTITGVPLGGPQMAGLYKLAWHAAAADDGHRTKGVISFTLK